MRLMFVNDFGASSGYLMSAVFQFTNKMLEL